MIKELNLNVKSNYLGDIVELINALDDQCLLNDTLITIFTTKDNIKMTITDNMKEVIE